MHAVRDSQQSRTYVIEQMRLGLVVVHLSNLVYIVLSVSVITHLTSRNTKKKWGSLCSIIRSEGNFFLLSVLRKYTVGAGVGFVGGDPGPPRWNGIAGARIEIVYRGDVKSRVLY